MARIVREFDLDAPMLSREARSEFRFQTRFVTNLFESCVKEQLVFGGAWKVLVEVVPEIKFDQPRDLLGVLVVQVEGDPGSFLTKQGEAEKGMVALSWLMRGAKGVAEHFGVSSRPLEDAAEAVRALEFKNVQCWLQSKLSPTKKFRAEVRVELRSDAALVLGLILDRDGKVVSQRLLVTQRPDEMIFASDIGLLSWIGDFEAELRSKDGSKAWRF